MSSDPRLVVEPLTEAAFAPFGQIIEIAAARTTMTINEGFATRYHDLARVHIGDAAAAISIFRARARPQPIGIHAMERHPLGSQAFMPLTPEAWLVVVCGGDAHPDPLTLRCFGVRGDQGVNYNPNIWHHPLLVLAQQQDFLVVDRLGPGANLDEDRFDATPRWIDCQNPQLSDKG